VNVVDRAAWEPAYRQVARFLREEIERGDLLPGDELPSERELAARYRVSKDTIRDGLKVLRANGLVVTLKGVGTRVADKHKVEVHPVPKHALISVRRATQAERLRLRLPEGAPVLVVETPAETQVYAAEWTKLQEGGD
jgi:DNA-binding GntR family transcriptional regulator